MSSSDAKFLFEPFLPILRRFSQEHKCVLNVNTSDDRYEFNCSLKWHSSCGCECYLTLSASKFSMDEVKLSQHCFPVSQPRIYSICGTNVSRFNRGYNPETLFRVLEEARRNAEICTEQFMAGDRVLSLIKMLQDKERGARWNAVMGLGYMRDSRAVEPLIGALDGDTVLSLAAAKALGQIGDSRAIEPLHQLLPTLDGNTRKTIVEIIQQLKGSTE